MRRACATASAPFRAQTRLSAAQALLGFRQRVRRADMHPHAVHAHAVGPAGGDRPAPHPVEREGAFRAAVEQARMGDRHAGEGERHDLLLDALAADAPVALEREVAAPLVAVARRGERQQQQAVHGARRPRRPTSRARLEPTPSIHTESALWIRKAPGPSRGSAFFTPPPVSSSAARSSEISMRGARRAAAGAASIRSAL